MAWHYGKLLRMTESLVPGERIAVHEFDTGRRVSRADFNRHVRNFARYLQDLGVERGTTVAICSRNCAEYLEVVVALFQTGLIHANVNFRYVADELYAIIANSDAEVVVFSSEFAGNFEELRDRLSSVKHYIEITGGEEPRLEGAHAYHLSASVDADRDPVYSEDPGDLFMMYTGGTTGLPKGVVWTQENIFRMAGNNYLVENGPRLPEDEEEYRNWVLGSPEVGYLVNAPFMHGLGLYLSLGGLAYGLTVVTNTAGFSAERALDAVSETGVAIVNVAGDAMAKPIYETLAAEPDRWDVSSVRVINSSSAVFNAPIKKGLIKLIPQLTIVDILGGSESSMLGISIVNADNLESLDEEAGLKLALGETVKVFDDDFKEVKIGKGILALSGLMANGYYKDPEKTAKTFPVIDGTRYCLLGDFVEVLEDGSIKFLGRGSVCINSGGEKIFPEEVEQAVKLHPSVCDCAIVGVPDDRWGEVVAAVVQLESGMQLDSDALLTFLRPKLASYKLPRLVIEKDDIGRGANGKLDYKACKAYAAKYSRKEQGEAGKPE